jgi:hypothetical protein
MSDTPETDAAQFGTGKVSVDFARRLERERYEVQSTLSTIHRWIERNHPDGFIDSLSYSQNLERVADNWYDRLDIAERERDEARGDLDNMQDQRDLAIKVIKRLEKERDEARAKP